MNTQELQISRYDVAQLMHPLQEVIPNCMGNSQFVSKLVSFLESSINISNFSAINDKLLLINFLDKVNRYREAAELERGTIQFHDIKEAPARLGNKAQSAFEKDE